MSLTLKLVLIALGISIALPGILLLIEGTEGYNIIIMPIGFCWLNVATGIIYVIIGLVTRFSGGDDRSDRVLELEDTFTDGTDLPQRKATRRERSKSYFLAAGIVVLIGGSLCLPFLGL